MRHTGNGSGCFPHHQLSIPYSVVHPDGNNEFFHSFGLLQFHHQCNNWSGFLHSFHTKVPLDDRQIESAFHSPSSHIVGSPHRSGSPVLYHPPALPRSADSWYYRGIALSREDFLPLLYFPDGHK